MAVVSAIVTCTLCQYRSLSLSLPLCLTHTLSHSLSLSHAQALYRRRQFRTPPIYPATTELPGIRFRV